MTGTGRGRSSGEGLVTIDGRDFYVIPGVDEMAPFLMNVVSDGDRWMFVSSTGSLTAGRVDSSGALFPYETDDRLHAAAGAVGPITRLRVETDRGTVDWRPFSVDAGVEVRRTLAKSVVGDAVVFEEHHEDLGLAFGYRWDTTDDHGFVRTATLANRGPDPVRVEVLDGLLGVLPHGLDPTVYQRLSNLTNAYKRSEVLDGAARLAVFSLESPVSDQAEPEEVLRANTIWSYGLDGAALTLDGGAVRAFDRGLDDVTVALVTGRPGAYLLGCSLELEPGQSTTWRIVADVGLDQFDVARLRTHLRSGVDLARELDTAVAAAEETLARIMAGADASQCTNDPIAGAHHVANVTYNVMRGGIPLSGYRIDTVDFATFVAQRNRVVARDHRAWLDALPPSIERHELLERIGAIGDVHLVRLGREYLPFSFSRRHGDPSRPWNAFSIRIVDDDGAPALRYEGNWRDVFQNWEALCVSFPAFLPGVVTLFVNASTADGYNPYRVTREGIDWEIPDPEDPWSNIGYWGDHQVVYLLRLLQATDRFLPGVVADLLGERCFTYAAVPYRIAAYDDLVRDPKATITFDDDAEARTRARADELGGDGKLVVGPDGDLVVVTLLEKLLVTALARLANFVPGGGIWMNTQRPEWNDANNALVGYGLSVVTLCHLRQFLDHLRTMVTDSPRDAVVTAEVAAWFEAVLGVLRDTATADPGGEGDEGRKAVMDRLGRAASAYRDGIYEAGFSGATVTVGHDAVVELCDLAIATIDPTIDRNRRSDGLVHSYNLVDFSPDRTRASVTHLPEMLEGQVAALGSGVLEPEHQADLVDALFTSALYRADQQSFILAPVRRLASFLDKNVVADDDVETDELLTALLAAGESSIVGRDVDGRVRFRPELVDQAALDGALDRLAASDEWAELVERNRATTSRVYEHVFEHHAFIGRSVAMYAYEGIGSIYWHMVTKLLVAIHDAATMAVRADVDREVIDRLLDGYERVRSGLGWNKSAADFGAVPTDPYSHTPSHAGAQQPGMTGAVKEELLVRPRELGVAFDAGELVLDRLLFRSSELLERPETWTIRSEHGPDVTIDLEPGSLGFTVCQVPVVVSLAAGDPFIEIEFADGATNRRPGRRLGRDVSAMLFGRTGDIRSIRAGLPDSA